MRQVWAYAAHDDPRAAAANFVALVLAWNQPFYPLYLWLILGERAWIASPDVLSGVAFALIPALSRVCGLAARVALPVLGTLNTIVCTWILGEASGVGLFLFPCAMLGAMLFAWRERFVMLAVAALPLAAWLATSGRLGAGLVGADPAELASLFTMNAVSAGVLMVFLGWVLAGVARDA